MSCALLLIDIQNDFLPTGALPVPEGDAVVPVANKLIPQFNHVVATQDWHPAEHGSFASQHQGHAPGELIKLNGLDQILWPDHCIQQSVGAEFAPELNAEKLHYIVQKGCNPTVDSYSGFADNGERIETLLHHHLQDQGVEVLFICGLALDYCVKFTVLDALKRGYSTYLIEDGCRGVGLQEGDLSAAIAEMSAAGAEIIHSSSVPELLTSLDI